jgi:UDPglucose 6-dehydrogenase
MRITVIGSGYVGLVTGACIAELGHQVICVDKDAVRIAALKSGRTPIYESGLCELVANNTRDGKLSFATNLPDALPECGVAFIAVGTPPRPEDGVADTVPVGTSERIDRIVQKTACGVPVNVVSNPEFLREGDAIADFMQPDRIVVGCKCERPPPKGGGFL